MIYILLRHQKSARYSFHHAPADTSPHNLSYFLGKTVNVCISLDATPISSVLLYRVTTRRKDWLRKVFGMSEVKPEAAE